MSNAKWTDKDTKDLKDFGIQILTIRSLNSKQAVRLCELIANACERIKELEEALQEIRKESGNINRSEWPAQQQRCFAMAERALKDNLRPF